MADPTATTGRPDTAPAAPTPTRRRVSPEAIRAAATNAARPVINDARRWWLLVERPPSLRAWTRTLRPDPEQVPDSHTALRNAWVADNHVTGLLVRSLSILLLLVAGGLAWLSMHPIRRWAFIACAAALATWIVLTP